MGPPSRRQARQRPTPHLYSYSDRTADMSLARTARLISSPRARLQLIPNLTEPLPAHPPSALVITRTRTTMSHQTVGCSELSQARSMRTRAGRTSGTMASLGAWCLDWSDTATSRTQAYKPGHLRKRGEGWKQRASWRTPRRHDKRYEDCFSFALIY